MDKNGIKIEGGNEMEKGLVTEHKFKIGDKVNWTNSNEVNLGTRTIIGLDVRSNRPTYYLDPIDTPWFSVGEEELVLPVPVLAEATAETEAVIKQEEPAKLEPVKAPQIPSSDSKILLDINTPAKEESPIVKALKPSTNVPVINEDLARRAKENMSFSDYKQGSATAEYNEEISRIAKLIESAKLKVSDEGKAKLDRFFNSYKARYANWINKYNANGSRHVSVMVAGPSNYNMKAHEKYLSREGKLWEEYEQFKNPEYKISSIVAGDKVIRSNDANAIEKLQAKLAGLEQSQNLMKSANAIIRKKKLTDEQKITAMVETGMSEEQAKKALKPDYMGRIGFASYSLSNNNANIRNVKLRIEKLQRDQARGNKEIVIESSESEKEIRIVDNIEAARLQIFFPGKPDATTRTELKRNGFRWAPSIGAWQSYRSSRANEAAKLIATNA